MMLGHLAAQPCPVQGVLDMLIRTDDELIPVDYKFTEGDVALNHEAKHTSSIKTAPPREDSKVCVPRGRLG